MQETQCDSSRIERFLDEQLGVDEEAAFEMHLEECAECRENLRAEAAQSPWWNNAGNFLSDDEFDVAFEAVETYAIDDATLEPQDVSPRVVEFLDATDDPRMLGRFGGYEIAGIIGYGGMGIVLKGLDTALNRYAAIKVLSPLLATSGAARQRFAREARAAAAVLHENVVAIHGVSESHGLPFLVMPYVAGESLQKRLDSQGPLQLAEILRIGMQVASGLAAAHAQGLVHRDIKPANILLENGVERLMITDFGLARAADDASITRTGVIAGTPQFMSPEQARGETVDHRSDLFSLGSVLYAACTGLPPFRAETVFGVLRRITESTPRPIRETSPEVPEWLCEIIETLQAKDPQQRFQSAQSVADRLAAWLAHIQRPLSVPTPSRLKTGRRRVRRLSDKTNRFIVFVVCAVAVCLATAFSTWLAVNYLVEERRSSAISKSVPAENGKPDVQTTDPIFGRLIDSTNWQNQIQNVNDEVNLIEEKWEESVDANSTDSSEDSAEELNRRLNQLTRRMEMLEH